MADEVNIGVGLDPDKAVEGLEDLYSKLGEASKGIDELSAAESELGYTNIEAFQNAVRDLADSFAESDPVFGKTLEMFGGLASGDYFSAIAAGFEAVSEAIQSHEKYVESVNAAYEKLELRINPNGEFAKSVAALKGTLEAAQAEGGDLEAVQAEQLAKIVEAKKKAAIRAQSGDGAFGAGAGYLGGNSGIINDVFGLGNSLEDQAKEEVEHRRRTKQGDLELDQRNKEKAAREKAAKEEEEAWAKIADARDKKEDQNNVKAGERATQKYLKEKADSEKAADDAAMAAGRNYLKLRDEEDKLTGKKDKAEETWARQQEMKAITSQKEKSYDVMGGYDAAYNKIAKGASTDGKSAEQIEKESNELKQKWHEESQAKIADLIKAVQERQQAGLGAP